MIWITNLRINNFQSHKDTTVEFDNGLNVITGASDQGKSAIVRAVKWVLFNEPRGTEFIKKGASMAKVSISFSNDFKVTRERSKSKNRYIVEDAKGQEKVFEGFGNDIPQEVLDAHGIKKVMIDDDISSCLNISDQLEGPFLLSQTASLRAKSIGRIIGLQIIDRAIRDCVLDLKRDSHDLESMKAEKIKVESKIEEYSDVEFISKRVVYEEKAIKKLENFIKRFETLNKLNEKLNIINKELCDNQSIAKKLKSIDKYQLTIEKINKKVSDLTGIRSLKNTFDRVNFEIKNTQKTLKNYFYINESNDILSKSKEIFKRFEKIKLLRDRFYAVDIEIKNVQKYLEASKHIKNVEKALKKADEKTQKILKLRDIHEKYQELDKNIAKGQIFINEKTEEINKITNDYTNTLKRVKICPTCGNNIDEKTISRIKML